MQAFERFPDKNKLSLIVAVITLILSTIFLLGDPQESAGSMTLTWALRLFPLIVGLVGISGTYWVLDEGSETQVKQDGSKFAIWMHFFIPGLAIAILGTALMQMARNLTWWLVYLAGISFFVLIIIAEYRDYHRDKVDSSLASLLLIATSLALYFILLTVFKMGTIRLAFFLPGIFMASFLISARTLSLHTKKIHFVWSLVLSLIETQIAAALYYLYITPVQFALILMGLLYAQLSLASGLLKKRQGRDLLLEPVLILSMVVLLFIIVLVRG